MSSRAVVLVTILVLGVNLSFAQSGVIQGVVSEAESADRVPFANVSLLKNSVSIPIGTISDEEGLFRMENLDFGAYEVVVSFIGYETDTLGSITLTKERPVADLGIISLAVSRISPVT